MQRSLLSKAQELEITVYMLQFSLKVPASCGPQTHWGLALSELAFQQRKILYGGLNAKLLSGVAGLLPQTARDVVCAAPAPGSSTDTGKLAVEAGRRRAGSRPEVENLSCKHTCQILSPILCPAPFLSVDLCQLYSWCGSKETHRPSEGLCRRK